MPLRFTLFKASNIVNLLLVLFTLSEVVYLVFFQSAIIFEGSLLPFLILAVVAFIYLGNIYWGFKLCKKYKVADDIDSRENNMIIVFALLQLICQLFMLFNLPEAVKNLEEPLSINLHMRRYNRIVLQFLPLIIFVVTFCSQLLLFPFMKLIRQQHTALLEKMNEFGKTNDAS